MKKPYNWIQLVAVIGLNIYCFNGFINRRLHIPALSTRYPGLEFVTLTATTILFLDSLILTAGVVFFSFFYTTKTDESIPPSPKDPRTWFGLSIFALLGIAIIIENYVHMGIIKMP